MNDKRIVYGLTAILIVIIGIISFYLKNANTPQNLITRDIKLFNKITQNNNNREICTRIENAEIKEKCFDNSYSIEAFELNEVSICENINSSQLKKNCKQEINKFTN